MIRGLRFLIPVLAAVALLPLVASCGESATEPEAVPAPPTVLTSYPVLLDSLAVLAALPTRTERNAAMDALWARLRAEGRIPYVQEDRAAFLYRGAASQVSVVGDFNGWNPQTRAARRLVPTDVWIQEEVFPPDSRLDYKLVTNGSNWILDPENPRRQRSGFGDNSELRMPDYVPSPYVVRNPGTPAGTLLPDRSLTSVSLGYRVPYRVYLPHGYDGLDDLPSIYVTDGHEYADDRMGSLVLVLDNLIAAGMIRPVIAVFIDPRIDGQGCPGGNCRADQYIMNPAFADFVAGELVPTVDGEYRTNPDRAARAILGTSLGGLNSMYFAVEETDTFRLIAVQSPAFQAGDGRIVGRVQAEPRLDLRIFMTWGTFLDFGRTTTEMIDVLDSKGYDFERRVVNEGHSWGNWRALLDDILVDFFPPAP